MRVEDVVDRESCGTFLNTLPESERFERAQIVAFRSAVRVAPFALSYLARIRTHEKDRRSALPIFVGLMTAQQSLGGGVVDANIAQIAFYGADNTAYASSGASYSGYAIAYLSQSVLFRDEDTIHYALDSIVNAAEALVSSVTYKAEGEAYSGRFWAELRTDLSSDSLKTNSPLWLNAAPPDFISKAWEEACAAFQSDKSGVYWHFWIEWFESLFSGRLVQYRSVCEYLKQITKEQWLGNPVQLNVFFETALELLRSEHSVPELEKATPVEFSFEAMLRVMRMIGVENNTAHLRDPAVVQSFLDDAQETRDGLQDFADYAKVMSGGGNFSGVLVMSAEKILAELQFSEDGTHLRSERIVTLAQDLEEFSKDDKAVADIGEALSKRLYDRLDGLKTLCRKHFGPAYAALAPLSDLNFDQIEQTEVLRLFDEAITWLEHVDTQTHVPIDGEGMAVFKDMQRELHTYRAAILEASSDEFREMLEGRFAAQAGAFGLTVGRYYQRSAEAAKVIDTTTDQVIAQYEKAKTLAEIAAYLSVIVGMAS